MFNTLKKVVIFVLSLSFFVPMVFSLTPDEKAQLMIKSIQTSSNENSGLVGEMAFDGNEGTRWSSSFSDNQWISVDFGTVCTVRSLVLNWEAAYASKYAVQFSDNGYEWQDALSAYSNGGKETVLLDGAGRYMRIFGLQRATAWGISLYEVEIYGYVHELEVQSLPVPGKIEAENYRDDGLPGYFDKSSGNYGGQYRNEDVDIENCIEGGYNVGWIEEGEYLNYGIHILQSGTYKLDARVASLANGGAFSVLVNGVEAADLTFQATGGWQDWLTISSGEFELEAGQHELQLVMKGSEFNLNWLDFQVIAVENEISVKAGEEFQIELIENSSTGYEWFYTIEDPRMVEFLSDEIILLNDDPEIAGAPHKRIWHFKGIEGSSTTIKFEYYRPWMGAETAIDTQVYTVAVNDLLTVENYETLETLVSYMNEFEMAYPLDVWMTDQVATTNGWQENPVVEHSETNIQVEGVDEADIVKTDGSFMYHINRNQMVITALSAGGKMEVASRFTFDDERFRARELYIDQDRLVVIGYTNRPKMYGNISRTFFTMAQIFDISNPYMVKKLREVAVDGDYITSRKIGNVLYLIAQRNLFYYGSELDSGDVVPAYFDSSRGGELVPLELDRMHYFPYCVEPNYMVVAGLDIREPGSELNISTFFGSGRSVYVSRDNLYIAAYNNYHHFFMPVELPILPLPEDESLIYKFALGKDGSVSYSGKGRVEGMVLNQFSMDEYGGENHILSENAPVDYAGPFFRVATTSGFSFSNNVFVLDKNMKKSGEITGFAPGEKIYSVRFAGKRGYVVTFRQVDPLFVLDLSNPYKPWITGQLKIPGYSNYLFPYGENHLIGIGREVPEDSNLFDAVKLTMFDITDMTNPIELDTQLIGDRYTQCEALSNHKAFLYDPAKNILALPLYIKAPSYPTFAPVEEFRGVYVYNLSPDTGFKLQGKISNINPVDGLSLPVSRILYAGSLYYTLSNTLYKASTMETLEEVNSIVIP